jgi:hypothetical protein
LFRHFGLLVPKILKLFYTEKVRRYLAEKEHYGYKNNNTIQSKTNQNKKKLTQHEL